MYFALYTNGYRIVIDSNQKIIISDLNNYFVCTERFALPPRSLFPSIETHIMIPSSQARHSYYCMKPLSCEFMIPGPEPDGQ